MTHEAKSAREIVDRPDMRFLTDAGKVMVERAMKEYAAQENKRLVEECAKLQGQVMEEIHKSDKYREALKKIATGDAFCPCPKIAREALKPTEGEVK